MTADFKAEVTAAVLVIGDEILSGRTKDRNIGVIADRCTALGIDLREVRIVADDQDDIRIGPLYVIGQAVERGLSLTGLALEVLGRGDVAVAV